VLDVIVENETAIQPDNLYLIEIYSESAGAADFSAVWKRFTGIMTTAVKPKIVINLANITSLDEKNLFYLEKMRSIAESQEGIISIINVHPELSDILRKRPALTPILQTA
jgi:hypothetical protein